MSVFKDSSITFLSMTISMISVLAWGAITARILGPAGKGVLAVALFYPLAFFTIGNLTINLMNVHYIGKKKYALEEFAGNSLYLSLLMGMLLYVIFLVTLPFFDHTLYRGIPPLLLYLAFAIVPLALIIHNFRSILQGVQKILQFNLVNVYSDLLKLGLIFVLVIYWRTGIIGALFSAIIGFIFGALLSFYYTKKVAPGRWRTNRELMKKLVVGGSKIHVSTMSTFLYGYMEIAMVNYFLSTKQVGYIAVAIATSRGLFLLSQAISNVLYPEVSGKSMKEAEEVSSMVCRNAFMVILGVTVLSIVFAKYLVLLYAGRAFLPAVYPLKIIMIGSGLATYGQLMSPLWVRKGWFWQLSVLAVTLLAVNLVLSIYLIPRYGLMGAAWAKMITYGAGFVQICIVYGIFVDRKFWRSFIPQRSDIDIYKSIWRRYILRKSAATISS